MAINRFTQNLRYGNNYGQQLASQKKTQPENPNGTPNDPKTGGSQGAPSRMPSFNNQYAINADRAFVKGGLKGLMEYLETLSSDIVSDIEYTEDKAAGKAVVKFKIYGEQYGYTEDIPVTEVPDEEENSDTEVSDDTDDGSFKAGRVSVNDFDLNNCEGKIYLLGGEDEEANLEQLKKDLEQSNIKEQFKNKYMQYYKEEFFFNHDFEEALKYTFDNLSIKYIKNENGEEVPCVKFEDCVAKLIKTFEDVNLRSVGTWGWTQAKTGDKEIPLQFCYKNQHYDIEDVRDLDIKRNAMKKNLMALKKDYASAYAYGMKGAGFLNAMQITNPYVLSLMQGSNYRSNRQQVVNLQQDERFAAIFEQCVDAVLDKVCTDTANMLTNRKNGTKIDMSYLVQLLSDELGKYMDANTMRDWQYTKGKSKTGSEKDERHFPFK